MRDCTALSDLVGLDDPIDPTQMQFTSKPGRSCRGCAFDGQRAKVCKEVGAIAVRAGLPDCERGVIYIELAVDMKQSCAF